MGTRGAYGFKKGKELKVTYNHFDSYPTGLGTEIWRLINNHTIEELKELYEKIVLVDEDGLMPEDIKDKDWYSFLRPTQGEPEALFDYEKTRHVMIDNKDFLEDKVFCEYSYIIDIEEGILIYKSGKKRARHFDLIELKKYSKEEAQKWLEKLEKS